jgi:hypothetical protein
MERRDFFRKLGIGVAAVVAAPMVMAEITKPKLRLNIREGKSFLDAGYVYAPYVPLQLTPTKNENVFYVATNGLDSNPGTHSQPFATLNRGFNALMAGSTLYVMSGSYSIN